MEDHFSAYIYHKRGFYYFSRRVPKEVQHYQGKQRIVLALSTRSRAKALKYSQVICQRLDERWLVIRKNRGKLWSWIRCSEPSFSYGKNNRLKIFASSSV